MNPEKLRGTYGKLIYFLQDSQQEQIRDALSLGLVGEIKTVYSVLKEAGVEDVLKSQWISTATREITGGKAYRAPNYVAAQHCLF